MKILLGLKDKKLYLNLKRYISSKEELSAYVKKKYKNSEGMLDTINYHNITLVLENFYYEIDFSEKSVKAEKRLIEFRSSSQIERDYVILYNVTKTLISISNEFKYYSTLLYENRHEGSVIISISSCDFKIEIPDGLVKEYIDRGHDFFIAKDLIRTTILLASIHRIGILKVVYKKNSKEVLGKNNFNVSSEPLPQINYTKGNSVVISLGKYEILSKLKYDKKLPTSSPINVSLLKDGDVSAYEFLNNSSFSSSIWIENRRNIINFEDKKYLYLSGVKINHELFTKTINYLNSNTLIIDYAMFDYINHHVEKSKLYKTIKNNLSYDYIKENFKKNKDTYNYFCNYELIKNQLMFIKEQNNGCFYNSYRFDRRYRIYVSQWPINYQLSHIVRAVITFKDRDFIFYAETYKKFFNYLEKKGFLKKFKWAYEPFLKEDFFIKFLKKTGFKVDLECLKNKDYSSYNYIINSIKLEALVIKTISLAPSNIASHSEKIKHTIDNFESDNINITIVTDSIFDEDIRSKEAINMLSDRLNTISILNGNFESIHWVDASSNALQLIVLAKGTNNETLLKLLNLTPNDTKYRNIYYYIFDRLLNHHGNGSLKKWKHLLIFLNVKQVKEVVMPLAYGKTVWSSSNTIIESLEENKDLCGNDSWKKMSKKEKTIFVKEVYDVIVLELKLLDFDIENHIKTCKDSFGEGGYLTHLEAPIVAPIYEKDDRSGIISKIKSLKYLRNMLKKHPTHLGDDVKLFKYFALLRKYGIKENSVEKSLRSVDNKLTNLDKKLKLSDVKSKKIKITIGGNSYQMRFSSPNLLKFKDCKKVAISPNCTHAYDACLLITCIRDLKEIGVDSLCIHDSIGTKVVFSRIAVCVYKINMIESVNKNREKGYFPYKKGVSFCLDLEVGIWESDTVFC